MSRHAYRAARGWVILGACVVVTGVMGCGGGGNGIGGHPTSGSSATAPSPECGALGQVCIGQGLDAPLALGGRYDIAVAYQIGGSSGPPTTLEVADPSVLTASDTAVDAVGVGSSAVMFIGPDDAVLDFIQVWVVQAEEFRIMQYSGSGTLLGRVEGSSKLLTNDEILVSVEPFTNSQPLLGNFDLMYEATGASVDIVPDPVAGWYRILARSPGTGSIRFSGLGITLDWPIEVLP